MMSKFGHSLVLIAFAVLASAQGIDWNDNWAFACDFRGNDLSNARTNGEQCGPKCESTSGCTHFTWNNFEGGTCWMKSGPVSKNDAFSTGDQGMVCGIVGSVQGIVWNGNWANACDFHNYNLSNARTSSEQCGPKCESTSGCTHFTWNNYEGGTCWMKSGSVSKNDAFYTGDQGMVCGIAGDNQSCPRKRVACYFPNWAYPRHSIEHLDVNICTHVIYSFAILSLSTHTMVPQDDWVDIQLGHYKQFVELKKKNPKLKAIIALGGWTDSQDKNKYKTLLSSASRRATFIQEAINFLNHHGFDGLDLDLEFPDAADKANFAAWVKELKAAFAPGGYELTVAVSPSPSTVQDGLDVPTLSANLDAIHIMSYDMHGTWDNPKNAENHAPLKRRPWDMQPLSVEDVVNKFISLGANPGKLVVGIPTYGRSFTMSGTNRKPPGVAFSSEGTSGPITQEPGILGYEEICMNIKHSGWTSVDDPNGPYAFKNDQWVGYDTVTSARAKAAYVNANNLGGAMFWQTSTNDFNNQCGGGNYPIIRSVFNAMSPCP